MTRRSRRTGSGSITNYRTKAGVRWRYQLWVPVDPENPDGGLRQAGKAGFSTAEAADDALTEAKRAVKAGLVMARRTPTVGVYLDQWIDSLDLEASTIAGYRRLARNHVEPYLGDIAINKLTATRISGHYKELREHGRMDGKDKGGALSANTVQKVHVLLGAMLDSAKDDGLIAVNPARKAKIVKAPTGKQIRAQKPEMVTWSAAELAAFLTWSRETYDDHLYVLWHVYAHTGMRRSEALALKFGDVDFTAGRISVRRALDTTTRGQIKVTKTANPRVVDVDAQTLELLKGYRKVRGSLSLTLARADAFVFSTLSGETRQPKAITKAFGIRLRLAREALGDDALGHMTIKGLRHTHASLLLQAGEHPKVVQERLGHTTITTTMDVYSHVTPTMQKTAADRFAAMLR